jgi:hypothetical protein
MTPFQVLFHFMNNKREIGLLEKSFLDIKNQLSLHEKQHLNTVKSYLKNRQEELEALEERYVKVEKEAKKSYDEALETETPDNESNIAYATHISEIDYLMHVKYEQIEEIRLKYSDFLDLFSKSTLIALYSLNENFLSRICDIASRTFNQKIKVSHFNSRDYLKASFDYLELVIDIPKESFESYISKLKEIQSIRNKIIHTGSQISDISILKLIKTYSDSLNYTKENQFLRITGPNFIKDFFNLLKNLYEELLWLLEERQNYKILKKILENWFKLIEGKISITEIKSTKNSKRIRTVQFKIKSDNDKIPELNGKLTFKCLTGNTREVINQTENELIKEFIEVDKVVDYLEIELKTFLSFNENLNIGLLIY